MRRTRMDAKVKPVLREQCIEAQVNAIIERLNAAGTELRQAVQVSQRTRAEARVLRQKLGAAVAWHIGRR